MPSQKTWMETSSKVRSGTGSKALVVLSAWNGAAGWCWSCYGLDMVGGPEKCLFYSHMPLMCYLYSVPLESGFHVGQGKRMRVEKALPHCRTVRLGGPRIGPCAHIAVIDNVSRIHVNGSSPGQAAASIHGCN